MARRDDEHYVSQEYRDLPLVVRTHLTPKEYAWLSNEQKFHLLEDFTEPSSGYVDE